jgi:4-diphosphocytidyl-2-C-methyl-D-erythritol kinase
MNWSLTADAPAKLNLFLHIIGRRSDGYHLLQSAFVLISRADRLKFSFRADGLIRRVSDLPGVAETDDLVIRAAKLLRDEAGIDGGCDIAVEKQIPMGSGMGGGSSDAAATLLALARLWGIKIPQYRLFELGLSLGADVPFFLLGESAFVEGIGEHLTPISLPSWWYLVLTPPVGVPTSAVFASAELTRDTIPLKIADFSAKRLVDCHNDLQPVVLGAFPVVARYFSALQSASKKSVFGARMTGSGASVFAAFESEVDARSAFDGLAPEYQGFIACGLSRHPWQ